MKKSPSLFTVVVPCYNAGPGVVSVIERILTFMPNVIVVDDGSTDGAAGLLRGMPIRLIQFGHNMGKGAAILAGFKAALETPEVDCVAILDADGQHDPNEIMRLYGMFQACQADLVIGAREFGQHHVPWLSWLGNTLTSAVTRLLLGRKIPDTQSGFRLHSRRFLEVVVQDVAGGRYETEMEILVKAVLGGYEVVSVPIRTIYERGNPSSHFRRMRDSWRVWRALFITALSCGRQSALGDLARKRLHGSVTEQGERE